MPIILFTNDDQKAIYLLNDKELVTFQTLYSGQSIIQDIRDCPSSDLAGLYVYENLVRIESPWPLDNQPFSNALLQKIAPLIAYEQHSILYQEAHSASVDYDLGCPRAYIPVCQDREFIVMLLRKNNENDRNGYVQKPNQMYQWDIPCVPVCHVTMGTFDMAVSECLSEHVTIRWHRTATGSYERVITEHPTQTLSWLQTADDFYHKIVVPYLEMVQKLHNDHQATHSDITEENIVLSERFGQAFFIDFVTYATTLYVSEDDKDENEYEYYCWHMERLYDLANLAFAIQNLAKIYLPNLKTNDNIVQYFSQLGGNLEPMVDQHFDVDDSDFELDIECIQLRQHHTIATISHDVHRLYAERTELSAAMQAPVQKPSDSKNLEKLVRKFSIYKEDEGKKEESTTPNNNKRQTLGSPTRFV